MEDTSKQRAAISRALASPTRDLYALALRVLDLQTADKLYLAAELLNRGEVELASSVARRAVDEIRLAQLLGKPKGGQ